MTERTLYIIQTDLLGQKLYSSEYSHGDDIPFHVVKKIIYAIAERPELIGVTFHDKESGNFYKAVYSLWLESYVD